MRLSLLLFESADERKDYSNLFPNWSTADERKISIELITGQRALLNDWESLLQIDRYSFDEHKNISNNVIQNALDNLEGFGVDRIRAISAITEGCKAHLSAIPQLQYLAENSKEICNIVQGQRRLFGPTLPDIV